MSLQPTAGYLGNDGKGLKVLTAPCIRWAFLFCGWFMAGHTQAKASTPRTTTPIHRIVFGFISG